MVAAGLIFLFGYVGNIRVFDTFGDWRDDEKRRKKEEDRQQGALASSIENIRGFAYFRGKAGGERRKRRGFFFFFIFPSFMVILWRFLAFGRGCEGEKKGKKRTL